MNIDLSNSIVIFDEAHNLVGDYQLLNLHKMFQHDNIVSQESCCGEATSFELSMSTLRKCVQEMKTCQSAVDPNMSDSGYTSSSFGALAGKSYHLVNNWRFYLTTYAGLLDRLRLTIDKLELSYTDELIKPGIFIYELLDMVEINSSNVGHLQQGIDSALQVLASLGMCS